MIKPIVLAIALVLAGSTSIADAQFRKAQAAEVTEAGSIHLNSATEADLIRLPGIGPSKAKAILLARQEAGGRFASVNDLRRVVGIGDATFAKIAPLCSL